MRYTVATCEEFCARAAMKAAFDLLSRTDFSEIKCETRPAILLQAFVAAQAAIEQAEAELQVKLKAQGKGPKSFNARRLIVDAVAAAAHTAICGADIEDMPVFPFMSGVWIDFFWAASVLNRFAEATFDLEFINEYPHLKSPPGVWSGVEMLRGIKRD